ncbi:DUF4255 domain-containing protein [Desulfobulbus propionicus]
MIEQAINQLSFLLNQYLKHTFDINEDIVVVSNIVDQDGSLVPNINNRILLFLVNIEKDTEVFQTNVGFVNQGQTVTSHPPVFINLYMMVAANFPGNNYQESLKFLSHSIGFFQRNPVLDHHNTPDLNRGIEKLILDLQNLSFNDLSNLWSIISGKYLPSVLYKIRMLTIDTKPMKGIMHLITDPQSKVR